MDGIVHVFFGTHNATLNDLLFECSIYLPLHCINHFILIRKMSGTKLIYVQIYTCKCNTMFDSALAAFILEVLLSIFLSCGFSFFLSAGFFKIKIEIALHLYKIA